VITETRVISTSTYVWAGNRDGTDPRIRDRRTRRVILAQHILGQRRAMADPWAVDRNNTNSRQTVME
jgi:hypothetical protein